MRKIGIAVKAKIAAFLMITITAIITGGTFYQGASTILIDEKMRSAEQETKLETVRIKTELDELRRDAQFLANSALVKAMLQSPAPDRPDAQYHETRNNLEQHLESFLANFVKAKSSYIQVRLVATEGSGRDVTNIRRIDESTVHLSQPETTAEIQEYFAQGLKDPGGTVHLSDVVIEQGNDLAGSPRMTTIKAIAPITSDAQENIGLLIISMDLSADFLLFTEGHSNELHQHIIVNDQGYYLEHFDETKELGFVADAASNLKNDFPQISHVLNPGFLDDSLVATADYQGRPALYTIRKLYIDESRPEHFIGFVEIIRYDAMFTALSDLREKCILLVLLIIVAGGLIAMTIARRMVHPLVKITRGMQAFAAGNPVGDLPTASTDELGMLAREFKHMVEEIKSRDHDLQISNERFKQIAEHLNEVFWIADTDYRLSYVSPAYEVICGKKCQTAYETQNALLNSIHPDDMTRVLSYLEDPARLPAEGLELDYRIVTDETTRWLRNRLFPVYQEDRLVSIVGVAEDITERKVAEVALHRNYEELVEANTKLEEAQNQLMQSEKMASIGQLAAGVAHEINNPIGYVNSNIGSLKKYVGELLILLKAYEQIEQRLPAEDATLTSINDLKIKMDLTYLKDDLHDLLHESEEGLLRVKKIVQNLKEFSHMGNAEWKVVDIHQGLDSTLNIVHNEIKYKAEVFKEYGAVPEIECIPSQLNQVFMNLLVNAAQAIPERGTITIRTGVLKDMAYVAVSDTGSGIEQKNLVRLFDPFFTTKPVGKGTGLGLSLSYSIVNKHAGHIDVESVVGEGSTFTVWLPLKQTRASETASEMQGVQL